MNLIVHCVMKGRFKYLSFFVKILKYFIKSC
nr:MAG TPA: hypothetical protein [Caudoviricetes sp.]